MNANIPRWWVIDPTGRILDGPCENQVQADDRRDERLHRLADGAEDIDPAAARSAYGVRRPDGLLEERQSPADKAWQAYLDDQLSRLSTGHDERLHPAVPHYELTIALAAALVESGFDLHDCAGKDPRGGVCLTPSNATLAGVIVTWAQHDRQARHHVRGHDVYARVQETMNYVLADVLAELGFTVQPIEEGSAHLVTADRNELEAPGRCALPHPAAPPAQSLTSTTPVELCPHPGAIDIVSLLGPADSNQGVPANDGREIGAAEGTCDSCGARVVTMNIYDPRKPWAVENGHGGTDRCTDWTPWR